MDVDFFVANVSPCTDFGVGGVPAAYGNASLVRLAIQLVDPRGNPITGLVHSDFAISAPVSGDIATQLANCPNCLKNF